MGTVHVQAVSERVSAMRAAQLSYTDAPIHVEIVQASDLQKAPAAPTGDLGFLGDAWEMPILRGEKELPDRGIPTACRIPA